MRAYLIVTGTLFGLLALQHFYIAATEWRGSAGPHGGVLMIAVLALLAGALSAWAWRLLAKLRAG